MRLTHNLAGADTLKLLEHLEKQDDSALHHWSANSEDALKYFQ